MTNHYIDMKNAGAFLVFSNPAENHPCCMQYVNEARFGSSKAPMLVVEPRRTRLGSMLQSGEERVNGHDAHLRMRPGTDIAFVNGLLKRHFANVDAASTAAYHGEKSNSKIPPGPGAYLRMIDKLLQAGGSWFADRGTMSANGGMYWPKWTDALFRVNADLDPTGVTGPTDYLRYGRDVTTAGTGSSDVEGTADPNASWYDLACADVTYATNGDWAEANQIPVLTPDLNPSDGGKPTVYQTYKTRVNAYDSAIVADICGCDAELFEQVADTYLNNSWGYNHEDSGEVGPNSDGVNYYDSLIGTCDETNYKAGTILYAMGTTQHTYGSNNVKSYANLQICTGNIGKHGGGVNALRGIGNVQGSTDMNLLYHILMAYVAVPPKYKITAATSATSFTVSGRLYDHNSALDGGYNPAASEMCSRVILADGNGLQHTKAFPRPYSGGITNCGTPVTVTATTATTTTITTTDNITNDATTPIVGDYVFLDYESWLFAKSFGPRTPFPSVGGNAVFPNGWGWAGALPWGHQGTWAVIRTFYSQGDVDQLVGTDRANVNEVFNKYMPKGAGYDHRTMVHQSDSSLPGYDGTKTDIDGWVAWGMNPRVTVANSLNVGDALNNLEWLLGVDMFVNETYDAPRKTGGVTYFLPAASPIETAGTTSNSGRWIQWRYSACPPIGDSKSDLEILLKLARALHFKCDEVDPGAMTFGYSTGAPYVSNADEAYKKIWRDQYAGDPTAGTAGSLEGTQNNLFNGDVLSDPATAWDNNQYLRSCQGDDLGDGLGPYIGTGAAGDPTGPTPGYAERVMIQTNTNSNDAYGNAGTNWLHGSKRGGGGHYGAWHDPLINTLPPAGDGKMLDEPKDSNGQVVIDAIEDAMYNRTQARAQGDSTGNKGVHPGFSWAWLRNRRCFYNKGGFCPGDIGDIFVSPNEVGTMFMGVPGYTAKPPVAPYSGCWRGTRNLKAIPISSGDRTWDKLGYTPVHWEPHESPRADLVAAYAQVGKPSHDAYATDTSTYPLVLTTYRHTEHFQGGVMTRNVPWLIELVPEAVVEINSVDAAANGIMDEDLVEIETMRSRGWNGPWRAVVKSGPSATQKVGVGVVAVPWHWGSVGLATGPTANDLCIDALDGNTNMPETKACLCKIRIKP